MQSRFSKILLCVGLFLLSLLFLSALVEGPGQGAVPGPKAFVENTALWPGGPGPQDPLGFSLWSQRLQRPFAAIPREPGAFQAPRLLPCRDANGRVLRSASYLACAFVLFHPEAAAG